MNSKVKVFLQGLGRRLSWRNNTKAPVATVEDSGENLPTTKKMAEVVAVEVDGVGVVVQEKK